VEGDVGTRSIHSLCPHKLEEREGQGVRPDILTGVGEPRTQIISLKQLI